MRRHRAEACARHLHRSAHAATSPRTMTSSESPSVPAPTRALAAGIAHELISERPGGRGIPAQVLRRIRRGDAARGRARAEQLRTTPTSWARATTWWRRPRHGPPPSRSIPEQRIIDLAHEIGEAKPCYICQGWGPQRRTNGEIGGARHHAAAAAGRPGRQARHQLTACREGQRRFRPCLRCRRATTPSRRSSPTTCGPRPSSTAPS